MRFRDLLKTLSCIVILLFATTNVFAQTETEQQADLDFQNGKYSSALTTYKICLTVEGVLGTKEQKNSLRTKIGDCYLAMGKYDDAKKYYEKAGNAERIRSIEDYKSGKSKVITTNSVSKASPTKLPISSNANDEIKALFAKAENGDALAMVDLGAKYYTGNGVPQNYTEAINWWKKAAEKGNAGAMCGVGLAYSKGEGVEKNSTEAIKWYRKAAEKEHATAMYLLAYEYDAGFNIPQDYSEAFKWYKLAAEKGNADAMHRLGVMCEFGKGIVKNLTEAFNLYKLAADGGNLLGMFSLGNMYSTGRGVAKNLTEAFKWYKLAADRGNVDAMCQLGGMYEYGEGTVENLPEAFKWYKKAADRGNLLGMFSLGNMYYKGSGVPQNYPEAIKWYRKAAEKGDADAMYNLGIMYFNGKGITQNQTEAINWWKKAAEKGNERAKKNLEELEHADDESDADAAKEELRRQEEYNKRFEVEVKKKAAPGLAFAKQNLIGHAFYADASEFMKKHYTSVEAQIFLGVYTEAYSPYMVSEFVDETHYYVYYLQLPKRNNISRGTILEALESVKQTKRQYLYYYKNGAIYDEKDKIQLKYVNGTLVDPNGVFPTLKKAY